MIVGASALHLLLVLVIAAIWVVPIALVVLLVVRARRPAPPDPYAVLSGRLARGEITPEEFETALRALGYTKPKE